MSILAELKRRNVFRVAALYLAVTWLLLQATDVLGSLLQLPAWGGKLTVMLLAIGFPIALVTAWLYELTPEGLKREAEAVPDSARHRETARRLNLLTVAAAALAIVVIVGDRMLPERSATETAADGGAMAASSTEPSAASQASATAAGSQQAIAVLPFVNMSSDREQEYFSDGVSEEILNLLANVEGLRVTSRTSSFSFKGQSLDLPTIASKLGVSLIVEGSVRRSGDAVRVTAQLIDVAADAHLWSGTYDRKLDDVFAIQADVAGQIARVLRIAMGADELSAIGTRPTADLDAWQQFLQARYKFRNRTNSDDLREALSVIDSAIARDSKFARAHSLRAALLMLLAGSVSDPETVSERMDAALRAADRALELNPELGEPYLVRALHAESQSNWAEADRNFREAIARAPNNPDGRNWYGSFLIESGYLTRGWAEKERAAELDPLSPLISWNAAFAAMTVGRIDVVSDFARKSRENGWPTWEPMAIQGGGAMQGHDLDAARRQYLEAFPQNREIVSASFVAIQHRRIDPDTRRLLDGLDAYGPPGIARWPVEVAAGDLDAAFATSFAALDAASLIRPDGSGGPPRLAEGKLGTTTRFDWWFGIAADFRKDPRFTDLVRGVGLLDFWRKNGWPDLCRPVDNGIECR